MFTAATPHLLSIYSLKAAAARLEGHYLKNCVSEKSGLMIPIFYF